MQQIHHRGLIILLFVLGLLLFSNVGEARIYSLAGRAECGAAEYASSLQNELIGTWNWYDPNTQSSSADSGYSFNSDGTAQSWDGQTVASDSACYVFLDETNIKIVVVYSGLRYANGGEDPREYRGILDENGLLTVTTDQGYTSSYRKPKVNANVTNTEPLGLCPGASPSFLSVGAKGQVSNFEVNLRSGAGTNYAKIRTIQVGTEFVVVGGPQCGSYVWWQIQLLDGTIGWVAEAFKQDYYVEPLSDLAPDVVGTSPSNNPPSALVGIWKNVDPQSHFTSIAFFPDGVVVPVPNEGDIRGTYVVQSNAKLRMDLTFTDPDTHQSSYTLDFDTPKDQLVLRGDFISGTFTRERPISQSDLLVCSGTITTHLLLGFGGQISLNNGSKAYLRSEPSTKAAVKDEINYSPRIYILGGPNCSEGFAWWLVQNTTTGIQGWVAEGKQDTYTLASVPIESPIPVVEVPLVTGQDDIASILVGEWDEIVTGVLYPKVISFTADNNVYIIPPTSTSRYYGTYTLLDTKHIKFDVVYNSTENEPFLISYISPVQFSDDVLSLIDEVGEIHKYKKSSGQPIDPLNELPQVGSMCVARSTEQASTGWSLSIVSDVYAARDKGFDSTQCTSLPDEIYPYVTRKCLDKSANAEMWDDQFRKNCPNFTISDHPEVGDIAVWEASAAGNSYGHVAIVENTNRDGTFNIHERNWAQNTSKACGKDRRCGLQVQSGISFIHVVCTTTPVPLQVQNAPSYLVVAKDISQQNTVNSFVYFDNLLGTWGGANFPNTLKSDSSTLFLVDDVWQLTHPSWTGFYWSYIYICSGQ